MNREECLAAAGEAFAEAMARRDALTPLAAAQAAYVPGGPTVAELEQRIRADRAQRTQAAA